MNKELSILIFSCDKYKDLWNPMIKNFYDKWSDCPYKIYLLTNYEKFNCRDVKSLNVGEDISWGSNALKALKMMNEEYILTLYDDLFFEKAIDTSKIKELFRIFLDRNMSYLKINYKRPASLKQIENRIGIIPPGLIYRSSAVMTIWKKSVLSDIISEDDNAWDFEIKGSERTNSYASWYGCLDCELPYLNLVVKGKYEPSAYKQIERNGIQLPDSIPMMTTFEVLYYRFRIVRSAIFQWLVPDKISANIRRRFRSV